MTTIRFTIPGVPVAQPRQRHRVVMTGSGKAFAQNYTPKGDPVNSFKAAVRDAASQAFQGKPLAGPIRLDVTFVLPRPKSVRGDGRVWAPRKPDGDNLWKSLADSLNGIVWEDDKQICSAGVLKVYAAPDEGAKTEVLIRALQEIAL